MSPDPAGRRTPRLPARGVATVPKLRSAVQPAGTVYTGGFRTEVMAGMAARVILVAAAMATGMVGGGLLFGQALAAWLGV